MIKDIPGFEMYYAADRAGNIYSVRGNKRLRPSKGRDGYLKVTFSINNERFTRQVHRLVAQTFIGPANGHEVNHKNGIRSDNRLENLEWLSRNDNQKHAFRELGRKPPSKWIGKKGADHCSSVPVVASRKDGFGFWFPAFADAQRGIGANCGHISECCNGNRALHLGFTWSKAPFPDYKDIAQ